MIDCNRCGVIDEVTEYVDFFFGKEFFLTILVQKNYFMVWNLSKSILSEAVEVN